MPNPETLPLLLRELRLSTIARILEDTLKNAEEKKWSYEKCLCVLCEQEIASRYSKRISRYLKDSKLPAGKTLATFDFKCAASVNMPQIMALAENSSWIEKSENLIMFGPSGVGKSHLAAAIGHAWIDQGIKCLFTTTTALVQKLQLARKEFRLPEAMHKLDKYQLLVLDDIGYAKKDDAETNVLFEIIAHRYECGSLIITANQPFSEWDKIFPDNMMAVAAIDRLVHHATIINIPDESYRRKNAINKI
jgi:DNA replication protein DnaC